MTAAPPVGATEDVPLFSERLTELLDTMFKSGAPNAGRFCGYCYTPLDAQRDACPHCGRSVAEHPPVEQVPREVLLMFRQLRRRESLVVNSYAYAGLLLAVVIFIGIFAVIFFNGGGIWWYVGDTAALFVLARVLPGLLGGYWGDRLGYERARLKTREAWEQWAAERG